MKATIFYFSGTGNTWWIAQQIKKSLSTLYETELISIESVKRTELVSLENKLSRSALIGFGYPIYGSDLPCIMKDFLVNMESFLKLCSADYFVFVTQHLWSGDGSRVASEFLDLDRIKWSEHFLMPNNLSIEQTRFYPYTNNMAKIGKYLNKNKKKVSNFCNSIINNRQNLKGFNKISQILGLMQRKPYRLGVKKIRTMISIDKSRCTKCKLCVKLCPVKNFEFIDNDHEIRVYNKCIFCLRCYSFCPEVAIKAYGKAHNVNKRGIPYKGPIENFDPNVLKRNT